MSFVLGVENNMLRNNAVSAQLKTFSNSKNNKRNCITKRQEYLINKILGKDRVEQIKACGVRLDMIHSFFIDDLDEKHLDGIKRSMAGAEANYYLYNMLCAQNIGKVEAEVSHGQTRIDIVAKPEKCIPIKVLRVSDDNKCFVCNEYLRQEEIAFEVKSVGKLDRHRDKLIPQLNQIKGKYKHCYVVVNNQTKIPNSLINEINELGAEIMRIDKSYQDFIDDINELKQDYIAELSKSDEEYKHEIYSYNGSRGRVIRYISRPIKVKYIS